MSTPTAKQEWSAHWPLPLIGMLGIAGSTTLGYSSGVFMQPMTEEFGWSRAQFSSAFTAQMLLALIVGPLVGRMIDRHGPRRVALVGVFAFVPGVSALGLATGAPWQWWALGALQAACTSMIGPPTWISAIVPRFLASRGMALAVALAGVGVGTAIWPVTAAYFVEHIGWRGSFAALALCWGVLMAPLTFLFFTDPPRAPAPIVVGKPSSSEYRQALLSRDFLCITLAGGLYASMSYAMILHSVPMLRANGLTLTQAATLAGIAGVCSIMGRLCTGYLLDRFRTRPIAVVVFLLPIAVSLLLRLGGGSWETALLAMMLLGLSAGAETDVVVYTASHRFGRHVFASVFAVIMAVFALFAAMGPLLASALFDAYQS
ncbi:MAG TPA: MFS transporter, partial [Sphingobium sp.]